MAARKLTTVSIIYGLLIVAFILFVFPFFLLIANSFKTNGEILENPFALPSQIGFAHFGEVISKMNFLVTFKNTFFITTASVALIVIFSAMTAYQFVRRSNSVNNSIFSVMVASMIIQETRF